MVGSINLAAVEQEDESTKELKLGEILFREGYIPLEAIQRVLDMQKEASFISTARKYKPFGLVCVELKLITREELHYVLKKYNKAIRLGELLVKMRAVKSEMLDKALKLQEKKPEKRLGEILVEMEALSENELVEALSLQWDIPVMLPALELIDTTLLDGIDIKFVHANGFLPVSQTDEEVTVVLSDPNDMNVINYLENHFGKKVTRTIGPASAVRDALKGYYLQRKAQLEAARQTIDARKNEPRYIQSQDAKDYKASSGLTSFSLYADEDEEKERAEAEKAEAEKAPPAPVIVEDSLIVGGVSLTSGDTQYKQQEGMLNYLIKNALLDKSSAIHLEPQGMFIRVRYRIDGVLHQKTALPANLGNPMVARLKQICALNPENITLPQRNRVQASFNDQALELGIATYPGTHGETMVLNLRQKQGAHSSVFLNLDQAGFSPLNLWRYKKVLSQPGGLVIVTGPARSGKSTTAYASLSAMNLLTRSISTAESPIEQHITGINQGNWTPESEMSYPEMIRSMSFLDPDVLFVSELDSPETIEASVEMALGGAKLLTTYTSFDSMGALLRLKTLGLEPFLIASSNLALLSQRLVRKLCDACKQQDAPHPDLLNLLGLREVANDPDQKVWAARGCSECHQTGYVGQTVLHEIMVLNESMREALLDPKPSAKQIRSIARNEARLVSMAEDGYVKSAVGITSLAEVQRVAYINEYDSHTPRPAAELLSACKGELKDWL